MTTLTTGLPLATVNFSFWILNTLKAHICTRDGLMDYQHRPCWFATRGESTNLYQVGLPKTELQVQVQVPSTASLVVNLLSDHSAGRDLQSPATAVHCHPYWPFPSLESLDSSQSKTSACNKPYVFQLPKTLAFLFYRWYRPLRISSRTTVFTIFSVISYITIIIIFVLYPR